MGWLNGYSPLDKWVSGLEIEEQVVKQNVKTNSLGVAAQMSFG